MDAEWVKCHAASTCRAGVRGLLNERSSLNELGFPPCWRAYFLLLRQKKVAKEKATPRSATLRGFLRYSAHRAACLNSPAAQTRQADGPRSACVAQRLSREPEGRPRSTEVPQKTHSCGQPGKKPKNEGSAAPPPAQLPNAVQLSVIPAQAGIQAGDGFTPRKLRRHCFNTDRFSGLLERC